MSELVAKVVQHWEHILPILSPLVNEADYDKKAAYLSELLAIVGENEEHPLMPLIDLLSDQIEKYDIEHYPYESHATGLDVLKSIMEEHGLKQKHLAFLGSQGVVSELLNGKRKLNVRHIKLLAEKFKVSPEIFMG